MTLVHDARPANNVHNRPVHDLVQARVVLVAKAQDSATVVANNQGQQAVLCNNWWLGRGAEKIVFVEI